MTSKTDKMEIDLEESEPKVVLPGDTIDVDVNSKLKLGPGLAQTQDSIICTKAGILNHSGNKWWVENNQRRVLCTRKGEEVVGIITYKGGEFYRVDIGSAHKAILPNLAFENANKKNRPILNIGSLVYARITIADKDMEPELSCIPEESKKSKTYGELKDGFVIKCSLRYCRRLFEIQTILNLLGKKCPFDIAIGMNGKIWLKSDSIKDTIFCCNVIKQAEILNYGDINEKEFDKLVKSLDI